MTMRLMNNLPLRVIQVLQDYLPTELDTIDTEEADGLITPDLVDWYEWDQKWQPGSPACSIRTVSSVPQDLDQNLGIRTYLMGERASALHRLDVMFHLTIADTVSSPLEMQKYLHRYISGAVRILCVRHEALDTVADPTRYVTRCIWSEPATYGPEVDQEDGAVVRSATLPLTIWNIEAR